MNEARRRQLSKKEEQESQKACTKKEPKQNIKSMTSY